MTTWIVIAVITLVACASLYYAGARRTVNATADLPDAATGHLKLQLAEIEAEMTLGRMGADEALAAKGELAREAIRLRSGSQAAPRVGPSQVAIAVPLAAVVVLSIGTYWVLGHPELDAQPLAGRNLAAEAQTDLETTIRPIEARLAAQPDDLRGWTVIGPAYLELGRYDAAVKAFTMVTKLTAPTAESESNLAEAMMLRDGGAIGKETLALFRSAAARDPKHVRSRFYIAGEETRAGDYAAAVTDWTALLKLGTGSEPWAATARDGLAFAQAALESGSKPSDQPQVGAEQIDAMVDGLEARLKTGGGSIEEWTQLVRSRMVQGRTADAQRAYDSARAAYPDASVRTELDVLAADNGLVAGASQ
jgi:cytochrome c-type biogenesis protein CcmH